MAAASRMFPFCLPLLLIPVLEAADIRLVGGATAAEGRVELMVAGEWQTICDEKWDLLDADVACRQLNLGYALVAVVDAGFGQGTAPIWSMRLNCLGSEAGLLDCPRTDGASCQHIQDAGVVCSNALLVEGSLRLAAGGSSPYLYGGRLEVHEAGEWGTVCNDVWGRQDAFVACAQMGFAGFTDFNVSFAIGGPSQRILLDNVECFGTEASLTICSHKGIGEHNCVHRQDVGIACSREESRRDSYRLVGGRGDFEGRVEVKHSGEWQTLCGLLWDINDAEVLCWELGYEYAVSAVTGAGFGEGAGTVWEVGVTCSGGESSISNCATPSSQPCSHSHDAGVVCSNTMLRDGSLRLVGGGSNPHAGRLEVYYLGQWGTVCDDNWDGTDAAVACHELGYASVGTDSTSDIPDGAPSQLTVLDMLDCTGSETRLSSCPHNGFGNEDCDHIEDVKLACSTEGINYIILGSAVGGSALFLLCLILLCVICVCLCCCCRGRRSKRARRQKKKQQQVARGFPNRLHDDGNIHTAPVNPPADAGYPVLQPTHSMSSVAYPQLQPAYSLGTFSTLGEPPAYAGLVSLVEGEEET